MRRALILSLALGVCPLLGACQPQTVNQNWQYRVLADQPPLTLSYAPGQASLPVAEAARARSMAASLPQTVVPILYAASSRDEARAAAIERLLDRPVQLARLAALGPDTAILTAPVPRGILSDACLGAGQTTLGGISPGDDGTAPVLLPSGCAVESDLAVQVSQPQDLVEGRPLPPGASLPYAVAIERYYDSFSGSPARDSGGGGNGGSGGNGGGGGWTSEPAGGASANPLWGPLPAGTH